MRVAGEQAKRAALAVLQQLHDFIGRFGRESRVAHVRHFARQVQQRLLPIIEFRRQRPLLGMIDAQALANVIESPADRQRRGSQNHGVELFEQPLPQDLAHVDGRGR